MIEKKRIQQRFMLMRPVFAALVFYIGFLTLAVSWVPQHPDSPWRYPLVILPMIPGIFIALGIVKMSAKIDEMERRILLEAVAFSFILSVIFMLSQGLLGLAGIPQLSSVENAAVMCFLVVIGKFWSNWRPVKNKLRVLRAERNWSQSKLGDLLGVSRQTINAIENGKYDPSLPLAFKMAQLFELKIEEIFDPQENG